MSELMNIGNTLPSKIEDLAKFVLIGRDQLNMVRAGIKALDKLDMAKDVREQKKQEAQMLAEALMDAEVRIGEILLAMPKASGKNNQYIQEKVKLLTAEDFHSEPKEESKPIETKKEAAQKLGFNKQQVERFQTLAQNKDVVEQVKQEARANDDLATRTAVLQAVRFKQVEEKKNNFEFKKNEFEKPIEIINTKQIIILGDSVKVLPTLENKTFDLLLSDPPYGMNFKSGWNDKEKITNDKIQDTVVLFEEVLKNAVPLLKDNAHFYLFGNIDYLPQIKPIIEKYLNLKNVLIWDRKVIGMGDLKSYGFSYDIIYFGYNKVWKDLNGNRDKDILSFNRVTPSANIHPTEKPVELLEYLIKKSTNENERILEPFAGGGSTLVACKNTNRLATGIEIEEEYYNIIKNKI
jgi:site-specific DNA-methyltransferase (adenine-specific)